MILAEKTREIGLLVQESLPKIKFALRLHVIASEKSVGRLPLSARSHLLHDQQTILLIMLLMYREHEDHVQQIR